MTAPGGARYCENCDVPQILELMRQARRRTRQDIVYDTYWAVVMHAEYPPLPPEVDEDWINGTGDDSDE